MCYCVENIIFFLQKYLFCVYRTGLSSWSLDLQKDNYLPRCCVLQLVNLFLRKGASANAKDKKERQPIHWAAHLGEYKWIR